MLAIVIVYPNALAVLAGRRGWDQWHAFMIGNAGLAIALALYAHASGFWQPAWGRFRAAQLWQGAVTGLIPLVVVLALIFLPGRLGRDIVRAGIGNIPPLQFAFRLVVQIGFATVLCEELAFRGVLFVLLNRTFATPYTVALDAAAYGRWHVVLQLNAFAGQQGVRRAAAAAGGVIAYGLLGVALAVLRQRAGGLAAPIVAHGLLDIGMFAGMYLRRMRGCQYATL